jgi:Na+-transporting NADH:ubiquinone oxidoreductase subunit NqrF
MTECIVLAIDEVVRFTEKSALIRVGTKVTWIPLSKVDVQQDDIAIEVPEWLYEKLIWTVDVTHVDYVATKEEVKSLKSKWNMDPNSELYW